MSTNKIQEKDFDHFIAPVAAVTDEVLKHQSTDAELYDPSTETLVMTRLGLTFEVSRS
jgi:hypothetical protein